MYSTEEKLRSLLRKVQALPEQHKKRAIIALAEIAEDFYMQDDEQLSLV